MSAVFLKTGAFFIATYLVLFASSTALIAVMVPSFSMSDASDPAFLEAIAIIDGVLTVCAFLVFLDSDGWIHFFYGKPELNKEDKKKS